jgi:hypothetical protein
MICGENTTAIHYEVSGGSDSSAPISLEIRPLVAFQVITVQLTETIDKPQDS